MIEVTTTSQGKDFSIKAVVVEIIMVVVKEVAVLIESKRACI